MACEILVKSALPLHPDKYPRGHIVVIKDTPCAWGKKECLPDYVVIHLTDATREQVDHYMKGWRMRFKYEIVAENDQGYRIKVSADLLNISLSGRGSELRSDMKDYIMAVWNAQIYSYNNYEVVIDIPKPVDLQELKTDIWDKFSDKIDKRLYYFTEAGVDIVVNAGGFMEITKQQALNYIRCRLDD